MLDWMDRIALALLLLSQPSASNSAFVEGKKKRKKKIFHGTGVGFFFNNTRFMPVRCYGFKNLYFQVFQEIK